MTDGRDDRPDAPGGSASPTTRAEFEAAIEALVREAEANGVTVKDGITLRTDREDRPDWDVEITRLGKL